MRGIKVLFMAAVVIVAVGGGSVVGMRAGRSKFSAPAEIKSGLVGSKTAAGIYVYAARTPQGGAILFDAGLDPEAHAIDALLAALGVGRDQVQKIFLTHGHFDHVAGIPQ